KAWLESRWRFLIGFALLAVLACGVVFEYPTAVKLRQTIGSIDAGSGVTSRLIREALEAERDYRGFVWWQWFRQNLVQTWTLFAVLLGSGGLLAHASGDGVLFTLSLPISRRVLFGTRAGTGLAQLFVLALVPSLLIPLLSPGVGERYAVGSVVAHGLCL